VIEKVFMTAKLMKKSRGRSVLESVFTNWNPRNVCLHVTKKLSYWDGETCKGELSLEGAFTRFVRPIDADGKLYAFEVVNKDGEAIMFSTNSDRITTNWINGIHAVVNNTWDQGSIDASEDHSHLISVERSLEALREEMRAMNVKNRTELSTLHLELDVLRKSDGLQTKSIAELTAVQIKTKAEVETLRQENLTLKAELLLQSRQSRLPVGSIHAFDGNEAALVLLAASERVIRDGL
jgi:hypothetical protein